MLTIGPDRITSQVKLSGDGQMRVERITLTVNVAGLDLSGGFYLDLGWLGPVASGVELVVEWDTGGPEPAGPRWLKPAGFIVGSGPN